MANTTGKKFGGRVKGTLNRPTIEIKARLDALGCDPLEGMVRLAQDPNNTPELRGKMFGELAQYIFPKRKAVEHSGEDGGPIRHDHTLDVAALDREQRAALASIIQAASPKPDKNSR